MSSIPVLRLRNPWTGTSRERSNGSDDDGYRDSGRHRGNEHYGEHRGASAFYGLIVTMKTTKL